MRSILEPSLARILEKVWRDVAGEVVLLNPKSDRIMGGGETWKLLDGERSLATQIGESFRSDAEQVLADLLVTVLVQRGLAKVN